MWGVDNLGLDDLDRRYLSVVIDTYAGGPVGIEAIEPVRELPLADS
jgi:Holliday junction DNA helicase RuvB